MTLQDHLKPSLLKNPLIVALDLDDDKKVLQLCDDLQDIAGGFKVGPRLCLRYGKPLLQRIAQVAPLFIDNKYFDIPNTMESAVLSSFEAGASLVTVHLLAGQPALRRLAELEQQLNRVRPFKILGVSILTSWSEEDYPTPFTPEPVSKHVRELIKMGEQAGLTGFVCSGEELSLAGDSQKYFIVPGVRLPGDDVQDQKRTLTPKLAIERGASGLVVGRPIVEAKDPRQAALDYSMAWVESSFKA